MAYLNHNVPPFTCLIRDEYLYDHQKGHGDFSVAEVHSVASMEHKVPLFETLLENGVNWTRRPIMAFCWKEVVSHSHDNYDFCLKLQRLF